MIISDKARELIAEIDAKQLKLHCLYEKLRDEVKSTTDDQLSVCPFDSSTAIQLWYRQYNSTGAEIEQLLSDEADDGELRVTHEDDEVKHVHFNIDRHPFCIVLSKETDK